MKRQIHLNLFIYSRGHHEAAWRHPTAPRKPLTDIDHYVACAQKAEAAHMDSIFLADTLSLQPDTDRTARLYLDPFTTLAAIAMATSRIGLIGTASTTHSEPFNLARMFASLDHISRGRAAWNIVTSFTSPGPTISAVKGASLTLTDTSALKNSSRWPRSFGTVGRTTLS